MTSSSKCRACKRRPKNPSTSGYGPVCERRINGAPPGRTPGLPARPAATPGPDQPELPYDDQLTLWKDTPC